MNTIKKCFEIIITGNRDESGLAARRVRKLVYNSGGNEMVLARIEELCGTEYFGQLAEQYHQKNYFEAYEYK